MNIDDSLRGGEFNDIAAMAQALKMVLRRGKNWEALPPESKEALELIATQIARILLGDPATFEHWNRMALFAHLRANGLEPERLENSIAQVAKLRARTLPPVRDEENDR